MRIDDNDVSLPHEEGGVCACHRPRKGSSNEHPADYFLDGEPLFGGEEGGKQGESETKRRARPFHAPSLAF